MERKVHSYLVANNIPVIVAQRKRMKPKGMFGAQQLLEPFVEERPRGVSTKQ